MTAWAYLFDTPGILGAVGVSAGAAAASDGVLLRANHVSLTDFATIVALAFLLSLVWQIARPHRTRVTESLAATLAASVLAVAGGAYLTLRGGHRRTSRPRTAGLLARRRHGRARRRPAGRCGRAAPGAVGFAASRVARPRRRSPDGRAARCLLRLSRRPAALAQSGAGRRLGSHAGGKGAVIDLGIAAGVAAVVDVVIDAGMTSPVGGRARCPPASAAPWPARLVVAAVLPVLVAAPAAYAIARAVLT